MANPNRVAAGKRNRALRGGITEEGRRRLREAAQRNRPWEHSNGPKSEAGRAQSRTNGKARQIGDRSIREVRCEVAASKAFRQTLAELRVCVLEGEFLHAGWVEETHQRMLLGTDAGRGAAEGGIA